ncbi:hypothetical protein FB45DRAFT_862932 [Roridomyces roridus]|uniref:Uncharacterized protein n=1 Tax=Roridomyces roridus TaxID=1738132 RepID=A0AAD7C8H2_9AGAR|nr:hypothetical protein FB45DRAFT_862932 [Roridomyces roridus]
MSMMGVLGQSIPVVQQEISIEVRVEQLLYRVVFLSEGEARLDSMPTFTYSIFLRLLAAKPADFFQKAGRKLFLGHGYTDSPKTYRQDVGSILQICTGAPISSISWARIGIKCKSVLAGSL